jgi:hypothetical protein
VPDPALRFVLISSSPEQEFCKFIEEKFTAFQNLQSSAAVTDFKRICNRMRKAIAHMLYVKAQPIQQSNTVESIIYYSVGQLIGGAIGVQLICPNVIYVSFISITTVRCFFTS